MKIIDSKADTTLKNGVFLFIGKYQLLILIVQIIRIGNKKKEEVLFIIEDDYVVIRSKYELI